MKDFDGSVKALAEAEGVDRNIITRCINTAGLPKDIIAIFQHPGELSARAGHDLFKIYQGNEKAMLDAAQQLLRMKKQGEKFDLCGSSRHYRIFIKTNAKDTQKTEKHMVKGLLRNITVITLP
ncbi:hypothetical protein [Klebsiella pneumoniae]|uniref:hypothetical protein n=1 Tax=Klebsiella pneumoniae TaxID=573 RepID=UPI00396F6752